MARSRNIKPAFFVNDILGSLPPLTRLLFIGLWCIADKNGVLENRSKKIQTQILPYDDCNIDDLIFNLKVNGFIDCYEVENIQYIQIVNFKKHQNPHRNEKGSGMPENNIREIYRTDREITRALPNKSEALGLIPDSLNLIYDSLSEKKKIIMDNFSVNDFVPTEEHRVLAYQMAVKIDDQLDKFKDWCLSHGKVYSDWNAGFRNWLRNARKYKGKIDYETSKESIRVSYECASMGCTQPGKIAAARSNNWYCEIHKDEAR